MTDTRKAGQRKAGQRTPQSKEQGQRKLTDKQEMFCREYIVDLNATQAAARAGYSDPNKGRQLVTKSNVQQRIAELQESRSVRTRITQDYVLKNLEEVLERCMQRAPVLVREKGEWVQLIDEQGRHVWQFDSKSALGALKQMGDHLGMFTSKVQVSGPDGGAIKTENTTVQAEVKPEDLEGLSAEELSKKYFAKK